MATLSEQLINAGEKVPDPVYLTGNDLLTLMHRAFVAGHLAVCIETLQECVDSLALSSDNAAMVQSLTSALTMVNDVHATVVSRSGELIRANAVPPTAPPAPTNEQ